MPLTYVYELDPLLPTQEEALNVLTQSKPVSKEVVRNSDVVMRGGKETITVSLK